MSAGVRIVREVFYVLFGLVGLIAALSMELEWYYAVLGAGMMVWGIHDIVQEVRDNATSGEVAEAAVRREEMREKLESAASKEG